MAFSGRHADQSVWVLTQKYNSVLKDLREQMRRVALFHAKDRDSFEDCLRENDVIPTREQRASVRQQLAEKKHAKLLLKTEQLAAYMGCQVAAYMYKVVTEGLLIAVLSAHLVVLVFVAWQILHFGQYIRWVRRLVMAIAGMDCDELIYELMWVEEQRQGIGAGLDEGAPQAAAPAGGTAATPDAPQGQEEERVQKHLVQLDAIAAGGQAGQYLLVVRGKAFTADQIDALDDTEIEKMYARYAARLGAAMTKTLGSAALQLYAGGIHLSPDPGRKPARAYRRPQGRPVCRTCAK